jgi:hypothetical protein
MPLLLSYVLWLSDLANSIFHNHQLCNMSLHNILLKVAGFITSIIVIIIDISTFLFYQYATPIDRMYRGYLANRVVLSISEVY